MGKVFLLHAAIACQLMCSTSAHECAHCSLSQSLLELFYTFSKPKVDRCWGKVETDIETGRKRPAIKCDFIVPKHYNSTAVIRRGSCQEFDEPICGDTAENDTCAGSFILTEKIRTVLYLDHPEDMMNPAAVGFNHTYCGRADIYEDIDNSGKQKNIAHASAGMFVTFSGNFNDYTYTVNMVADPSESDSSKASIIGSLVAILIVLLVLPTSACFLIKRRKEGTKIHDSANVCGDTDKDKVHHGDIGVV